LGLLLLASRCFALWLLSGIVAGSQPDRERENRSQNRRKSP